MDQLVILVRFQVVATRHAEFLNLVNQNAAASLADEPGCQRFDVLTHAEGRRGEVVLYEIYESAAAFDAHCESAHYAAFREATREMVTSATIERLLLQRPSVEV